MIADGGDAISDLAAFRNQPARYVDLEGGPPARERLAGGETAVIVPGVELHVGEHVPARL